MRKKEGFVRLCGRAKGEAEFDRRCGKADYSETGRSTVSIISLYWGICVSPLYRWERFSTHWWRLESSEGLKTRTRTEATLRMPPELFSLYISGKRFFQGRAERRRPFSFALHPGRIRMSRSRSMHPPWQRATPSGTGGSLLGFCRHELRKHSSRKARVGGYGGAGPAQGAECTECRDVC